jgi:hypothetical protein
VIRARRRSSLGAGVRLAPGSWAGLVLGLLLAGLALAALRVDGIRVRYALSTANREEKALEAERAQLLVRVRELRHPERLAAEARRLGLERPERVIALQAAGADR